MLENQPVDCYGPAGTCIFWHHRGMHGPGVNHSDRMRLAVLHEWVRKDVNDGPPPVRFTSTFSLATHFLIQF